MDVELGDIALGAEVSFEMVKERVLAIRLAISSVHKVKHV